MYFGKYNLFIMGFASLQIDTIDIIILCDL